MAAVALAASMSLLAACGGEFEAAGGTGEAGAGGSGSGGDGGFSGEGGTGGADGSCLHEGRRYEHGESVPSDDCNSCSCNQGEVACTLLGCPEGCLYGGVTYEVGASFSADDGCNTCTCNEGGEVACTRIACNSCDAISAAYSEAIDQALACDPGKHDQCSEPIAFGLACTCHAFANPENADAISAVANAQRDYAALACGGDVICGPCPEPSGARCSDQARCELVYESHAACKVGGVVYESGATGIPDPTSCNTCTCFDGQLSCTEIACPTPCPPNSVYGTQCAECGPVDQCLVVEHACLPVCDMTCDFGLCIDGVCRTLCG